MSIRLLVTDLDNTLYDWVGYFVPAFYTMVAEAARIVECSEEKLLDSLRDVHREHHDSEYPFALLDSKVVLERFPDLPRHELATILDPALHAFNRARKALLRTYPGVHEGLQSLIARGVAVVAHTESNVFAVEDRVKRLGLVKYFTRFYCRERPASVHPGHHATYVAPDFPDERVVTLSRHQRKPDAGVLLEICKKEGFSPVETAYVGDSIVRDVMASKAAGVFAIWAKFGSTHSPIDYARLVRISHWSESDVRRERELHLLAGTVTPDYVLESSFDEIIEAIRVANERRPVA